MGRIMKFLRNLFSCHKQRKKNFKHQEQAECTSLPTILAAVDFDSQSDNDVVSLNKCSTNSNNNLHGSSSDHIVTNNDGSQISLEALLETVAAETDAGHTNSYPQQSPQSEFLVIQTENEFKLQLEPMTDDKSQNDELQFPVIYDNDEEDADGDPKTEDYAVVDQKFMMSVHVILFNTSRQPENEELGSTPEEGELGGGSDDETLVFPSVPDDKFTRNNNDVTYSETRSCTESNEGGSDNWEDGSDWFTLSQREFESWHGVVFNQITFHCNMPLSTIVEESEPDEDSADEPLGFSFVAEDKFTDNESNNHGVDKPYQKVETDCEDDIYRSGDDSDTWSGPDSNKGGSDDLEGDSDWCTLYSL